MTISITTEDPRDPQMTAILQTHLEFCQSATPIENSYALDVSKLISPEITCFGARIDGQLVGVGAIRILDGNHAELKSMHTLIGSRGQGVGKAIVEHIIDFAKARGITRLSLETGTFEDFLPARKLYESMGFEYCDAFGDYVLSEYNTCMTKYF